MIKILFIGNLFRGRSLQRFNTLKKLGHEVFGVTTVPNGGDNYNFWDKIKFKLGYPSDKTGVNNKILNEFNNVELELVWVEKSLMLKPAALRFFKKNNIPVISFSEDDMFNPVNQSRNYLSCLPIYDLVFTTKSYNCDPEELPALGAGKVEFTNKSFDPDFHKPLRVSHEDNEKYGSEVGFIGTFENNRAEKMLYLAENNIKIRIWGNGWSNWVKRHKNLCIENRPIYGEEYIKAICSTDINLCFLRKDNRDLQTDRTMEIPACGGFMLAERTCEHTKLFREGEEADFFDIENNDELLNKIVFWLDKSEKRKDVARAGRLRCINSNYSHDKVVSYIVEKSVTYG